MRHESAQKLTRSDFKRSYGIYPETFEAMVKVVKVERMLQKKTGRKDKLGIFRPSINDTCLLAGV